MRSLKKPNLPEGAAYIGNGPVSTVFSWHGVVYRFAQGRRGGTIYRARPCVSGLVHDAAMRRAARRNKRRRVVDDLSRRADAHKNAQRKT